MDIKECELGQKNGRKIKSYILTNNNNVEIEVLNIGCAISRFMVPDKSGEQVNIVLGFPNWEEYLINEPFFGVVAGRVANRIADGKFSLDGKDYQLPINNGPNSLHGGNEGFSHKIWDSAPYSDDDTVGVVFKYSSPDGEENYPGTMNVTIDYSLNDKNELTIKYSAKCDKKSIINLTNHSYFNLAGSGTALKHNLTLNGNQIVPVDENLIPTGEFMPVAGTAFDFNTKRSIGKSIKDDDVQLKRAKGYDHSFVLQNEGKVKNCARLEDEKGTRWLEVDTDAPGVQLYTGNYLDGIKGNEDYVDYSGVCLETQNFPDAVNQPNFPSPVIEPGQEWSTTTIFRVGT